MTVLLQERSLILGGPGAGKTTRLLGEVESCLSRGVPPSGIAFVAFTNAAADEARARACERFGLAPKDLPLFRTIHSLAFRQLGLRRSDVLSDGHLAELSEVTGELMTGDSAVEGPAAGMGADPLLTIDHYARATVTTLADAHHAHGGDVEWFRLKRFSDAYRAYKEERGLLDFTDMLSAYAAGGAPAGARVAIVDEAQDLTLLQWRAVDRAFSDCGRVMIGGDDDQAVYRWAGAADEHFRSLEHSREVLPLSHRLPRRIFSLAAEVIGRVSARFAKDWRPADGEGSVEWVSSPDEADLSSGKWLLLARTRAQLADLERVARDQGVVYSVKGRTSVNQDHLRAILAHEALRAGKRVEAEDANAALRAAGSSIRAGDGTATARELGYDASPIWHDALVRIPLDDREYYLACRRRGERLGEAPRVRIETIHGAKGAEAERVLVVTDLTYRTRRAYELDPDSEARVFYVAVTRASESLVLVAPRTAYGFPL